LATVILSVEITVGSDGLVDVTGIGNAIAIDVVVAGIDGSVGVAIGLATVDLAIEIAVCAAGEIGIAIIAYAIIVAVIIVDESTATCSRFSFIDIEWTPIAIVDKCVAI
jgi:hypothetical protein